MDKLNLNHLLNRTEEENILIENLKYFENNKEKLLTKRGFYLYGAPGSGKTFFVSPLRTNDINRGAQIGFQSCVQVSGFY